MEVFKLSWHPSSVLCRLCGLVGLIHSLFHNVSSNLAHMCRMAQAQTVGMHISDKAETLALAQQNAQMSTIDVKVHSCSILCLSSTRVHITSGHSINGEPQYREP